MHLPVNKENNYIQIIIIYILLVTFIACNNKQSSKYQHADSIAKNLHTSLENNLLDKWYPKIIDTIHGGFLSNLDRKWQPTDTQGKFIVTQARHIWTLSEATDFLPDKKKQYHNHAKQGLTFLKKHFLDRSNGGFYSYTTREGNPLKVPDGLAQVKFTYGKAFAIYGLARYMPVFLKIHWH